MNHIVNKQRIRHIIGWDMDWLSQYGAINKINTNTKTIMNINMKTSMYLHMRRDETRLYHRLTFATLTTRIPSNMSAGTGTVLRHVLNLDGSGTYLLGMIYYGMLWQFAIWYFVCYIMYVLYNRNAVSGCTNAMQARFIHSDTIRYQYEIQMEMILFLYLQLTTQSRNQDQLNWKYKDTYIQYQLERLRCSDDKVSHTHR